MYKKINFIIMLWLATSVFVSAQTLSPRVTPGAGGYTTSGGISLSWTLGETFSTSLTNGNIILTQGEQQPEIDLLTGTISSTTLCAGSTVYVPYSATGYYDATNTFTAQLSDAAGSFSSPVIIGSATGTSGGTVTCIIPNATTAGSNYHIRVVSNHPSITGRDNQSNITVTAPCCNITLSGLVTHVLCHGGSNGSIDVSSSNTAGTAAYLWNNGNTSEDRSGLSAGTYTVTVTYGSGCSQSQSFIVTQPNALSINGTPVNVTCRGAGNGSITLAPSGGTSPYSYHWNNGSTLQNRTALAPGTYVVTVNDANLCGAVTQLFTITQPANNLSINSSKTNIRCNGIPVGVASVSPAGGTAPYFYSWNTIPENTTTTVSGLAAGSYTCTVTDINGCTKSIIISITEPPAFVVIQAHTNVSFPGGNNGSASVSVSGGTPGYTYSWNTVPVKTTSTITGLTAGVYKCTITDNKSCTVKVSITITQPVARESAMVAAGNKQELVIFPNPSDGVMSVKINGLATNQAIEFIISDITGRIIYQKQMQWLPDEVRIFDFSWITSGVYSFSCQSQDIKILQKIIIE